MEGGRAAQPQPVGVLGRLTLVVMGLLLFAPMLDARFRFLRRSEISGMSQRAGFPEFSWETWYNEKYQHRFANWALKSGGLWSWSIKLSNEFVYRLTGEISTDYDTSVQGGNEGYLWQAMYRAPFNRVKDPPVDLTHKTFQQLAELQSLLEARGVHVLALINPNLIFTYPELFPLKYQNPRRLERQSSYEVALDAISKTGAHVIDAAALFKERKTDFPFRLFAPTGSHWNDVGACLAAREVLARLGQQLKRQFPTLPCDSYELRPIPAAPDRDLVQIANLLAPERLFRPTPYVSQLAQPMFPPDKPKLILVGTSFLFGLEHQLKKHNITDDTLLLFYFRQQRRGGRGNFNNFSPKNINWGEILSADAIILDINESGPAKLGYGFIKLALKHLRKEEREATQSWSPRQLKRQERKLKKSSLPTS